MNIENKFWLWNKKKQYFLLFLKDVELKKISHLLLKKLTCFVHTSDVYQRSRQSIVAIKTDY